jgi:hypothetical protein
MSLQLDKKKEKEKPLDGEDAERAAFAILGGKRVGD